MPDTSRDHALTYLAELLEQWRALPAPGSPRWHHCAPCGVFDELAILARRASERLPPGVTVSQIRGVPAFALVFDVEGLGPVRFTSEKPLTMFGAIATVCRRIAEEATARSSSQPAPVRRQLR